MSLIDKLLITAFILSMSSQVDAAYVCFKSTEFKGQSICYESDHEKSLVTKKYFVELTKNLSIPGNLITLQGEMANHYTPEKFLKSFIKHYSHITQESVGQIISHGNLSAVFLSSGETMYFNHDLPSFIFDFDSPLVFVGAHRFYAEGSKPATERSINNTSNCNLQKDGVHFLSPPKDSFFYREASTYCTYADVVFEKKDNTIAARPVSSIGKKGYSISGANVEFKNFIEWLQRP